jgi:hypothetical protein
MLVRGWLLVLQGMNGMAEDGAAEGGEGEGREYDARANRPASWQPSIAELAGARELAVTTAREDEASRRGALLRKGRSRSMSDEDDLRDLLDKYQILCDHHGIKDERVRRNAIHGKLGGPRIIRRILLRVFIVSLFWFLMGPGTWPKSLVLNTDSFQFQYIVHSV